MIGGYVGTFVGWLTNKNTVTNQKRRTNDQTNNLAHTEPIYRNKHLTAHTNTGTYTYTQANRHVTHPLNPFSFTIIALGDSHVCSADCLPSVNFPGDEHKSKYIRFGKCHAQIPQSTSETVLQTCEWSCQGQTSSLCCMHQEKCLECSPGVGQRNLNWQIHSSHSYNVA